MRLRHAVVVVFLAFLVVPAGARADTVVGEVFDSTPISSHGGLTAWSVQGDDEAFRLVVFDGEATSEVPIAARSVPFDVDLGPGPDGGVVAAYSRCDQEPRPFEAYTAGRGCDIFTFSLAAGREERLEGVSTDQASEMLPSVWRDEVAFARVYEQREGRRDGYDLDTLPYLYIRPLDGDSGSRRQPLETRGSSGTPGPVALDLYGQRLGFIWQYQGAREAPFTSARIVTDGEPQPGRVAQTGGGGLSNAFFLSADFDRGRFVFGLECVGDSGGCDSRGLRRKLLRFRLSTDELDGALVGSDRLLDIARSDAETFYVRARATDPQGPGRCATSAFGGEPAVCEVLRSDPLDFRDDLPALDNIEP